MNNWQHWPNGWKPRDFNMPLEQVSNALNFYAFYVSSKQGVTGLTVTVDVYKVDTSGTSSSIVTAGSATAIGGGLYTYRLTSGNTSGEGEYIAIFKTASTSPDQQHIPAIWVVNKAGVEYLDAQVTSRLDPAGITSLQSDVTAIKTPVTTNLDAAISSRLPTSGYTAPDNTSIGTILTRTDVATSTRLAPAGITSLQSDVTAIKTPVTTNLDATISSRLPTSGYTAPDNTSIGTILGRVDVATSTRLASSSYAPETGAGGISYTVTVTRQDGATPIEGCAVWVTTDSIGHNIIAGTLYTNASGNATFLLDAGTYYLWRQATGWNFTNPTSFTVS